MKERRKAAARKADEEELVGWNDEIWLLARKALSTFLQLANVSCFLVRGSEVTTSFYEFFFYLFHFFLFYLKNI